MYTKHPAYRPSIHPSSRQRQRDVTGGSLKNLPSFNTQRYIPGHAGVAMIFEIQGNENQDAHLRSPKLVASLKRDLGNFPWFFLGQNSVRQKKKRDLFGVSPCELRKKKNLTTFHEILVGWKRDPYIGLLKIPM